MHMTRLGWYAVALVTSAGMCFGEGNQGNQGQGNQGEDGPSNCQGLPTAADLTTQLTSAAGPSAGGLFGGARMWGAVVNRDGKICAYATNQSDNSQVWPGSQAIAKAKAYTANAFSLDTLPLSTANLYTLTQPGHSLWSLGQSNSFNPEFLAGTGGQGGGTNQIAGGLIFFGGGLPLYKAGKIIGGLGVSGDTSCTDHEIAKRVRNALNLNPSVAGVSGPAGPTADDIQYSAKDGASPYTHPACANTWRNGTNLGLTENNASGY